MHMEFSPNTCKIKITNIVTIEYSTFNNRVGHLLCCAPSSVAIQGYVPRSIKVITMSSESSRQENMINVNHQSYPYIKTENRLFCIDPSKLLSRFTRTLVAMRNLFWISASRNSDPVLWEKSETSRKNPTRLQRNINYSSLGVQK